MEKRSNTLKIENNDDENVVYCRTSGSTFGRKKKKGGGGGATEVDCSNLGLTRLDDFIKDMRVGGFIRVKSGENLVKKNIDRKTISGINLADNNLSDGDNLKEFLAYLPSFADHKYFNFLEKIFLGCMWAEIWSYYFVVCRM